MFYLNLFGFVFFVSIDQFDMWIVPIRIETNRMVFERVVGIDRFWSKQCTFFCLVLFWFDRVMVNWLSAIYLIDWFCYRFCKVKLQAAEVQSRIKISSHWFKVEFLFCVCGIFQYRYYLIFFIVSDLFDISRVYCVCFWLVLWFGRVENHRNWWFFFVHCFFV